MIRYTEDEVKGGLPDSPAKALIKDIVGAVKEYESETEAVNSSIMWGIIIVVLLFAGVGYFIWSYFKD